MNDVNSDPGVSVQDRPWPTPRTVHEAELLWRQGQRKEAAEACQDLLQADPRNSEVLNLLGLIAVSEARNDAAVDFFQRAIRHRQNKGYWLNLGTTYARMERWSDAESCYREALTLEADDAEAYRKLGAVFEKTGRVAEACTTYRKAIETNPGGAEPYFALGAALHSAGQVEEGLAADSEGLKRSPDSIPALVRVGGALRTLGKLQEGLDAFERAKSVNGKIWEIHANIGSVSRDLRRFDAACEAYGNAVALNPNSAESHLGLGLSLADLGKRPEATDALRRSVTIAPSYSGFRALGLIFLQLERDEPGCAALQRAIELRPDQAEPYAQYGDALRKLARLGEACVAYRTALVFDPKRVETHHGLALALRGLGRFVESRQSFEKAIELNPNAAELHNNHGNALREFGLLEEARSAYQRALDIRPDYAEAMTNLATVLKDQGKIEEAIECYERAIVLKPELAVAHGNLLYALSYRPGTTLDELAVAHRAWNDRFARPYKASWPQFRPAQARARPRIGFVSADFKNHPVGYFTVKLFEGLRKNGADFVCYANQTLDDQLTSRFRAAANTWRPISGLSDDAVADRIKADEIDILFDMSGFTSGNRLPIFARKPAPVQVTCFGYVATTGLEAMDYILADRYHIPVESEEYYTEKVIRLPDSLLCFDPPATAPPVTPLPALQRGYVTFGSFNVLCKISPLVVKLWARILKRVPNSQLLLKTAAFSCPATRLRYENLFSEHGIDARRLVFQGLSSRDGHMAAIGGVDIALDPFPYVGCTITAECSYMGVPVITWPGQTFPSRHSLSLLSTIGMTETIVDGLESYEEVAVSLSQDLEKLAALRAGLRPRMLASPLCDAEVFTRHFEEKCTEIWDNYRL